ncbi:MAG: thioredoxin domain-containing protein [Dehalococcoidia bacterium]|nr:thioredoxin domain-containing protein [Dehalococcoidia bacterium]
MTEPDPDASSPPAPQPPNRERPLWTAFLTPIAVVIGAVIIAGAIWVSNEDDAADDTSLPADGSASTAPVDEGTAAPPGPATLLAAFEGYGEAIQLDGAAFDQCLADAQSRAQVIGAHLNRGSELGVTGTPTFFINNKMIVGAQPPEVFDEIIDRELEGSPATLDGYSPMILELASSGRFAIVKSPVDVSDATIEGNPQAKVMIAEFSDFQCPFCQRWNQQNLERVRERLGDDVAMAFLHFPITQIHPNAGNASVAAVCAGEQGKFWEMHDLLFARQQEWQNLPPN